MSGRRALVTSLVLSAFLLTSCKYIRGIGRPEGSLAGRGIQSLTLEIDKDTALCPGFSTQLKISARSYEGDTYSTDGKTRWANFDISMQGGVVSPGGKVQLHGDPRVTWKRPAVIEAVLLHNPRILGKLSFTPRYDCAYRAYFHKGRGKALKVEGTLDIVGEREGKPIARLILSSPHTSRAGMFYFTESGSVTITLPEGNGKEVGEVSIRVSPSALPFQKRISLGSSETRKPKVPNPSGAKLNFTEEELYLP